MTDPKLRALVRRIAEEEGVDPDLAEALVQTESSFRPWVVSNVGAVGLAQIKPSTARSIDPNVTAQDLFNPETNVRLGLRYFKKLRERFQDDRLALSAYNMGPTRVRRRLARGLEPDTGYARKVFGFMPKPQQPTPIDLQRRLMELTLPSERLGQLIQQLEVAHASRENTPAGGNRNVSGDAGNQKLGSSTRPDNRDASGRLSERSNRGEAGVLRR